MSLLQLLLLATLALVASALVGGAIVRLMRAQAGRTATSVWRGEPLVHTLSMDDRVVPTWVHRLHADGLPSRGTWSEAPSRPASQRFIDRWRWVTTGY